MPFMSQAGNAHVFSQAIPPTSGMVTGDIWIQTIAQHGIYLYYNSTWNLYAGQSPTFSSQNVILGSDFTTTSASFVDVTGMTITMPTRTNGISALSFFGSGTNSAATNGLSGFRLVDNAVTKETFYQTTPVMNIYYCFTKPYVTTLAGQIVKLQATSSGGVNTVTVYSSASGSASTIISAESSQ